MKRRKAVIVEEDATTRDALYGTFLSKGWEVGMLTTLAEGMVLPKDDIPDRVLVSSKLSDGWGAAIVRQVRTELRRCRVAVLESSPGESVELKPNPAFSKPVDPSEVDSKCRACDGPSVSIAGLPRPK